MLSFTAGRSIHALHIESGKSYIITTVEKDNIEKKDILLGVLTSSDKDLVVLRELENTYLAKTTLLPDGDPFLMLLTDGILQDLGAPVGKHTWTLVFTSYIPDNVGCYLGQSMDTDGIQRNHVTLHDTSSSIYFLPDKKDEYKKMVVDFYKVRINKKIQFVNYRDKGVLNEKGTFEALMEWTQVHAANKATITQSKSSQSDRVERKYKVGTTSYRSAPAYLEALSREICRDFAYDMAHDSSDQPKYVKVDSLDSSYYQ